MSIHICLPVYLKPSQNTAFLDRACNTTENCQHVKTTELKSNLRLNSLVDKSPKILLFEFVSSAYDDII